MPAGDAGGSVLDAVVVTSNLAMGEALVIAVRDHALTIGVTDASADPLTADAPVLILDLLSDDDATLARMVDLAADHQGRTLALACGPVPAAGDLQVDGWISVASSTAELATAVTDARDATMLATAAAREPDAEALTSRERAVLAELLAGHENDRVIASRLDIGEHSVRAHVQSVLTKLGVGSASEVVSWALRTGAVGPVPVQGAAS